MTGRAMRPGPREPGDQSWGPLLAAATAALGATAVSALHRRGLLPGGSGRWERRNHQGRPVTLTEGLALAVGSALPLAVLDPPACCAILQAGVVGAADDLTGSTDVKGLRGHLAALGRRELTTGVVKILVLVEAGIVTAFWSDRRAGRPSGASTLAAAGLVAGGANLANLFDLRPGRALKVALVTGLPLAARSRPAAAVLGAGLSVLPGDLAGRSMLGDTGANALGAGIGLAVAQRLSTRGRWAALALVAALTLASERVSFTRVIESTPVLREIDRWGRR